MRGWPARARQGLRRYGFGGSLQELRLRRRGLNGPYLDIGRARLAVRSAPVILECGANDGAETQAFLDRWPAAEVHCFEPEPRASALWRERITSDRAHLYEVALAAEDGEAVFHRSSGAPPGAAGPTAPWHESGSLRRPTGHLDAWPWVAFDEQIDVRTRSLDSWALEHTIGDVDLIWADVQGAEEDLIRGATGTLRRTRYLYTEVSDTELYEGQIGLRELLALLPGWEVVVRYPDDVLLRNTRHPR